MLRLVEVILPTAEAEGLPAILEEHEEVDSHGVWTDELGGDQAEVRALVDQEDVEPFIDLLESRYGNLDAFRILVMAVETSLPRPEDDEADVEEVPEEPEDLGSRLFPRISRDELYDTVTEMAALDGHFLSFVFLATIVAAIGLLQDNVAVIIGSMVIAPLIGPVACLSLATVLADVDLARRAAVSNAVGVGIAMASSVALGLVIPIDPSVPELARRAKVSLWDVGLGLAVGGAGSLSFTTGLSTALVGVMVAVALLPPLVASGLFLGDGHVFLAGRAGLQALVYLISINLSGVAVFALQGIRPANWWEKGEARRATRLAIVLWTGLLALLALIIWYIGAVTIPGT